MLLADESLKFRYAVLSGCKVLGMYEYDAALNESRQRMFPNDFPDSLGYQIYAQQRVNLFNLVDVIAYACPSVNPLKMNISASLLQKELTISKLARPTPFRSAGMSFQSLSSESLFVQAMVVYQKTRLQFLFLIRRIIP